MSNGSATLPFVIPSVPGFPPSPLSPATTYVVLPKENHMQLTEAATLDRKSGEADLSRRAVEGSAVPRTPRGNVFRPDRSVVERSAVSFFVLTHTLSLLRPYGPTQSRAQQSVKSFLLSLPSS